MTAASSAPTPRRFGRVNWIGLATFASRNIRRTLKTYRYSLLGPLVSNMLFLTVFHLALGDRDWGFTIGFSQFLVGGLVVFATCERAFEAASEYILYDKMEGMIWDTLMAPLSPLERTIGYTVGAASVGLLTGAIVLAASLLFVGLPAMPDIPLMLFFAMIGAIVLALGGIIAGTWAERWDHQSAINTFLLLPLSFLSGCYYPIGGLPEIGRQLIQLNPVFYIVDGVLAGLTGFHEGSLPIGAAVLLSMAAVLFVLVHRLIRSGYKVKP